MKNIYYVYNILFTCFDRVDDHSIIRQFPNDCFSFFRLFSVSSITTTIFVNTINFETISYILLLSVLYINQKYSSVVYMYL